jgi:predicted transcriptional regulator
MRKGWFFATLSLYLYKLKSMEIWKPVIGINDGFYDGYYEISNLGRFKMLPRLLNCTKGMRVSKEKIVTGSSRHGYKTVSLKKDRIKKVIDVHILVARAFITNANPEKFKIVNHLNSDRADNRAENLEWCDHSRNAKHAYEAGKLKITRGSQRSTAILNEDKVMAIKLLYKTGRFSYDKLANLFEVGSTTIQNIINGTKWTHVV